MKRTLVCLAFTVALAAVLPVGADENDESTTSTTEALPSPPKDVLDALTKHLCGDSPHCCFSSAASAGRGRTAHAMTVVRLDRYCGIPHDDRSYDCRYEHWLAIHAGQRLLSRQRLAPECHTGPGWYFLVNDAVSITPNLLLHTRTKDRGSLRIVERTSVVLDPVHVGGRAWSSLRTEKPSASSAGELDLDAFRYTGSRSLPLCGRDGQPPAPGQAEAGPPIEASYQLISRVHLPAEYVRDGWKRISLGDCATAVDGVEKGFLIYGEKGTPADSRFSVVSAVGRNRDFLFVELLDDRLVGPGRPLSGTSWLYDDHLELWLTTEEKTAEACTDKQQGSPKQWAIRITDGKVFAAMGRPRDMPRAERVLVPDVPGLVRLRIELPEWKGRGHRDITVVYSDSDDGKRQTRVIATSQIKLGWAATLGETIDSAHDPTCVPVSGRLEHIRSTPVVLTENPICCDLN